jgi:hypothetical protein
MLNSRGTGATPDPSSVTVNSVRDNWAAISDFSHADIVSSGTQALGIMLERRAEALKAGPSQGDARRDANKAKTASTGVSPATPAGTGAGEGNGWESARIMAVLKEHLDAEVVKRVKSVFVFDIEKEGSRRRWMLDAKSGEGSLQEVTGVSYGVDDVSLMAVMMSYLILLFLFFFCSPPGPGHGEARRHADADRRHLRQAAPQRGHRAEALHVRYVKERFFLFHQQLRFFFIHHHFFLGKLKVRGSIATAMKFEQVLRSMEHRVQGKL